MKKKKTKAVTIKVLIIYKKRRKKIEINNKRSERLWEGVKHLFQKRGMEERKMIIRKAENFLLL